MSIEVELKSGMQKPAGKFWSISDLCRFRPLYENTSIAPFEVEHSTSGDEPLYTRPRTGNTGTPYNYSA